MTRTEIITDDGRLINFETVTRVADKVDRLEVAELEAKLQANKDLIAQLEAENQGFIEKLEKAKAIIELADAKKAEEQAEEQAEVVEEEAIAEEEVQAVESVQVEEVE